MKQYELHHYNCNHKGKLVEYFKDDNMTRFRCMKCNQKWEQDKTPAIVFFLIYKMYKNQK